MINTCSAADEMWNIPHDELGLASPAAAQVAAASEDEDPLEQHEVDEVAKRRWKAEQANKVSTRIVQDQSPALTLCFVSKLSQASLPMLRACMANCPHARCKSPSNYLVQHNFESLAELYLVSAVSALFYEFSSASTQLTVSARPPPLHTHTQHDSCQHANLPTQPFHATSTQHPPQRQAQHFSIDIDCIHALCWSDDFLTLQALWAFGGRVRQVQQGWKQQQDEAKRAPKRQKTAQHTTTHSGPLLLLNQLYWEQQLGSSIHRITEDNMFGINMFGSYRSICQNMLNSNAPAAAGSHLQNSNSSCNRDSPIRSSSNNQTVPDTPHPQRTPARLCLLQQNPLLFQLLLQQQQKQQQQQRLQQEQHTPLEQQQAVDKELQDDANSAVSADGSSSGSGSGSGSDHSSATPAPATPMMGLHDLHEIEAVCRQQQLMHLPANRRFVKAVRFLQAAKQQAAKQQQQQ
jgi:hypothetical protein